MRFNENYRRSSRRGFTLIELLIVIAIVAVLAVVVILTLNPAQLLKQARDSTRISDLATIKSSLALYLSDVTTPSMGNTANCYVHSSSSLAVGTGCSGHFNGGTNTLVASRATDGTGWIPVNFGGISAGSPLTIEPVDPVNNSTYFYAYRVGANNVYDLNTHMESIKFANGGSADVESTDGGSNPNLYEVGSSLTL